MINNNLKNLTFFGQDWGGLIGLRMIADNPDRFNKVSIGNTGLPYSPNTSDDVIQQVNEFRQSKLKLTPMSMAKQIKQMDSGKTHPALKFMYWQKFCWDTKNLPVGLINSIMMEKNSKIGTSINYIMYVLGIPKISPYFSDLMRAYEAPFPNYT